MAKIDIPVETLLTDLHGTDWEKRCTAARLLGQSGDPRAVDALLPDLNDPDWRVRRNAAQALGALKSARAVEPLLEALNDGTDTVRQRAAVALGRIKDPEAIPVLIRALTESQNSNVSEAAYQALKKFGRKAGPQILEALKAKEDPCLIDLLAIIDIEGRTQLLIEKAARSSPQMQKKALVALGKVKNPMAVGFLIRMLHDNEESVQALAIGALGELRAVEAAPQLLDLLKSDALYGPNSATYHAVCEAFQEIGDIRNEVEKAFPGNFPSLATMMSTSLTLPEAISTLAPGHIQKLNAMLAHMEERMQEMGKLLSLPAETIDDFTDKTWQFGVLFADAQDARAERVKVLTRLLLSDVPLKRAAAALALPWYTDPQALASLEQATHDSDELARRAATWAHTALKATLRLKHDADSGDTGGLQGKQ